MPHASKTDFLTYYCSLQIRNKNTAQIGIANNAPRRSADPIHAKKPPIANPIFPFIAPTIAGIDPIINPIIKAPKIALLVKASILSSCPLIAILM